MITRLFLLILLTSTLHTQAQKFNVNWGDNAKLKYDYEDAVPLNDGKFIILKFKAGKRSFFGGGGASFEPILVLVDKNMESINENELAIEEKNASFKGFERYGDNVFFLYESYSKEDKTTSVHALKINEKTLATSNHTILGTYSSDSRSDQAEPSYKLSLDSSKVLLFVEGPDRKKENKKFFIGVFDTNLKSLWKKEIELPIGDRYVSIYDQDVTNDGKVIVAIKHYDKEVTRQTVREDGAKIPSYMYKLFIYDGKDSKGKEMVFNLNNQYIQGTKLTYNTNKNITIAGLYKRKYNGRINGAFYATLDLNTSEIKNPVMAAFPDEFVEMIDKDGFGSDSQKDPGLSNNFRIMHIMNRTNGTVDLISEYYRLDIITTYNANTRTTTTQYRYTFGDIVNTNIDKDGKAIFTRVPKNQKLLNSTAFLGYFPFVQKDKLILFYNDDRDNVERDLSKKPDDVVNFKRSIFMATTIDSKGNISRESVYDHRDEDYITAPMSLRAISKNRFMISSYLLKLFKKRTRFGIMEIK